MSCSISLISSRVRHHENGLITHYCSAAERLCVITLLREEPCVGLMAKYYSTHHLKPNVILQCNDHTASAWGSISNTSSVALSFTIVDI